MQVRNADEPDGKKGMALQHGQCGQPNDELNQVQQRLEAGCVGAGNAARFAARVALVEPADRCAVCARNRRA